MENINWGDLANQFTSTPKEKKDFIKEVPITKNSVSYFRVTTFTDSDGAVKLFREVKYHWVSTYKKKYDQTTKKYLKDAEGNDIMELGKTTIPCEGEGCRFCALASKMKDAGCRDEFMYRYNTKLLVVGSLVEKAGSSYVYSQKDANGHAVLVPLVFDSGSRQNRTFNLFMAPENLYALSEMNPNLNGKDMNGIMKTVWGRTNGLVFKFTSGKEGTGQQAKWANKMEATLQTLPLPLEANLNLDEIGGDYSQEYLDKCYEVTSKIAFDTIKAKLERDGEEMYEPEASTVVQETKATAAAKPPVANDVPFDTTPASSDATDPLAEFEALFGGK